MRVLSRPPIPPEQSYVRLHLIALLIAAVLAVILACATMPADAQEAQPPDLVVTLRDAAGAPVVGAQIVVRDTVGGADVVHATTDATGRITVGHVPVSTVRVAVSGTTNGLTLHQVGQDATGVQLLLTAPPTTLDLRVDADGSVLPDPATMISPDQPVPVGTPSVGAFPTAPRAPALRAPTAAIPTLRPTAQTDTTTVDMALLTPTPIPLDTLALGTGTQPWVSMGILALLALGGIGVYLAWRKL